MRLSTWTVLAVLAMACPGADPDTDTAADTDIDTDTDTDTHTDCTINDHVSTSVKVTVFPSEEDYFVTDRSTETFPTDLLSLEVYKSLGGPSGPFTQTLDGENYATCSVCLLAFRGCAEDAPCTQAFLAQHGELDVSTIELEQNSLFKMSATDLKLTEVTINPDTFESTPVSGGDVWCVDTWNVDTLVDDGER